MPDHNYSIHSEFNFLSLPGDMMCNDYQMNDKTLLASSKRYLYQFPSHRPDQTETLYY